MVEKMSVCIVGAQLGHGAADPGVVGRCILCMCNMVKKQSKTNIKKKKPTASYATKLLPNQFQSSITHSPRQNVPHSLDGHAGWMLLVEPSAPRGLI